MDFTTGGVRFQLYALPRKSAATLICYRLGSARERLTFKGDLEAAQKHCKTLARTITSGDGALHLSPLDHRVWLAAKDIAAKIGRPADVLLRDHLEAIRILGGKTSIVEAARHFVLNRPDVADHVPVAEIVDELLAAIKGRAAADRLRYHEDIKQRLGALTKAFPNACARDLTASALEAWLGSFKKTFRASTKRASRPRANASKREVHFWILSMCFLEPG